MQEENFKHDRTYNIVQPDSPGGGEYQAWSNIEHCLTLIKEKGVGGLGGGVLVNFVVKLDHEDFMMGPIDYFSCIAQALS